MSSQEALRIDLQVGLQDSLPEDIDQLTRQLLGELQEQDVETAELVAGGSIPSGAKAGEAIELGVIAVAVLPALLPKLVEFFQAWALRGQGRTIKFKGVVGGLPVELECPAADLKTILASLPLPKGAQ